MPITVMCSRDVAGAVRRSMIPYQSTMGVPEWWSSDRTGWQGQEYRPTDERDDFWTVTTHAGLVLETRERNGYDDSDFYAIVWDVDAGEPKSIEYASTRGWTYPNHAEVDATPEIKAYYHAWQDARAREAEAAQREAEAKDPTVGKRVKVTGGRGPKGFGGRWQGTEAVIFWRGANGFRTYYRNGYNRPDSVWNQRVGLRLDDGRKVFTALTNVEVVR